MEAFLDEKPFDKTLLGAGTLEDGLRAVQIHVRTAQRILVGFRCNGEEMGGKAMAEALRRPIASFAKLELFTSTRERLVLDTMTEASASLEETESTTQQVADMLIQGRTAEAIRNLGQCLQVWQQIHDAVGKSLALLEMDPKSTMLRDTPIETALSRPRDVLLQIKQALLAQDHVLLADILQYEFADVTGLWHSLIARIRRQAEELQSAATGAA